LNRAARRRPLEREAAHGQREADWAAVASLWPGHPAAAGTDRACDDGWTSMRRRHVGGLAACLEKRRTGGALREGAGVSWLEPRGGCSLAVAVIGSEGLWESGREEGKP
jgi:hypothetical protein